MWSAQHNMFLSQFNQFINDKQMKLMFRYDSCIHFLLASCDSFLLKTSINVKKSVRIPFIRLASISLSSSKSTITTSHSTKSILIPHFNEQKKRIQINL